MYSSIKSKFSAFKKGGLYSQNEDFGYSPPPPPPLDGAILLESGGIILLETSGELLLE